MTLPVTFDHCVVHVSDWERSNAFYRDVLGAELVTRPVGWAYRFGAAQLNLHGPGLQAGRGGAAAGRSPATAISASNGADRSQTPSPISSRCGVPIHAGPMERFGAKGAGPASISATPTARCSNSFPISTIAETAHDRPPHNPNVLPADLPAPQDDGGARHLTGLKLAARGARRDRRLAGRSVEARRPHRGLHLSAHRRARTGAARRLGCNPGRARLHAAIVLVPRSFRRAQAARRCAPFGLSTQDTAYQREAAERLHLPFPVLSDESLELARAIELPTFTVAGMTLLKRMALVIDDGVISKVFYPVFPPDKNAEEVIAWLQASEHRQRARVGEHVAKHLGRQHAGIGVVARAVIAVEHAQRADARATRHGRTARPSGAGSSAASVLSCEIRPSVTMARRFGISAMVAARNARQVLISAGVGLFSGGTQRTALVMRASTSARPSSGRACIAAARQSRSARACRRAGRRHSRR